MSETIIDLVVRFNEALNRQDLNTMMAMMTEDCVFDNTEPSPDGRRYTGQKSVRAFWEEFFRSSQEPRFETEEIFAAGERCVTRWVYHWVDGQGQPGHIRGADIFKVRDDKIAEKLSYVKG